MVWRTVGRRQPEIIARDLALGMTIALNGRTASTEATYKLQGDMPTMAIDAVGKQSTETLRIKTLTDPSLVTEDQKKRIDELRRKR